MNEKHILDIFRYGLWKRQKIRKARKNEYEFIAWTVYEALGVTTYRTSQMQRACIQDNSLYSWKNTTVLVLNGKPVAAIIAYPGNKYKELRKHTFPYCWDSEICSELDADACETECQPNEYYIDSLAVLPEFRCNGYARSLLQNTEKEAKKKGFWSVSLLADKKHPELIQYYRSMGYFEKGIVKFLDRQFIKMKKNI